MRIRPLFRMLVVAIMVAGPVLAGCSEAPVVSAEEAMEAPALQQPTLDNGKVALTDFRGKVVLLNFWATWCPYCKKEIPHLIELQEDLGDRGLQVVGAAMNWKIDSREPKNPDIFHQKVASYALKHGLNYPVPLVKQGMDGIMKRFGDPAGVPYTVLIDTQGRIRATFQGNPGKDKLWRAVKALL
ncbi:TlpA family protein disulfide reductase [Thiohalorhabdus sp.]|uniref:TlpA family protein disulfide reductase n=1 Tax=Thiohalorhabdus sp. TaxID=3094134 RepID=UPI002FC2A6AD